MLKIERQTKMTEFIYNKLEKGYTVKKLSNDMYEFKIKTSKLDIEEKIHSSNFLTNFVKIN
jgi:hypothetical protein